MEGRGRGRARESPAERVRGRSGRERGGEVVDEKHGGSERGQAGADSEDDDELSQMNAALLLLDAVSSATDSSDRESLVCDDLDTAEDADDVPELPRASGARKPRSAKAAAKPSEPKAPVTESGAASASNASGAQPSDGATPVIPAPEPAETAEKSLPAEPPSSKETTKRSYASRVKTGTERKLVLPDGIGEVHFYPSQFSMCAFCRQHERCRKTKTTKPSQTNEGQGRPLGYLIAWLQLGKSEESHWSHVNACVPTLQQREEARTLFLMLDADKRAEWEGYERSKRENEPDEPPVFR